MSECQYLDCYREATNEEPGVDENHWVSVCARCAGTAAQPIEDDNDE